MLTLKNFWKRFRKSWGVEFIIWSIAVIWLLLFREGHRFLPGAKRLGEIIPPWLVILNLVFLFISTTLLMHKTNFNPISAIVTLIGFLLSSIVWNIGYERFPLVTLIGAGVIILFNLGLKKWGSKGDRIVSSKAT